jgi:hypothetical protein
VPSKEASTGLAVVALFILCRYGPQSKSHGLLQLQYWLQLKLSSPSSCTFLRSPTSEAILVHSINVVLNLLAKILPNK